MKNRCAYCTSWEVRYTAQVKTKNDWKKKTFCRKCVKDLDKLSSLKLMIKNIKGLK